MKCFPISTSALLLALTATTGFAQSPDPKVACLRGTWAPDLDEMKASLRAQVDTPDVKFSGSLSMIINTTNVMDGVEFHADNWSLLRIYPDKPDTALTVNGVAKLSISAPHWGSFYLAEASNTYVQKLETPGPEGPINDPEIDPIRAMLPMGEFASGEWTCVDDVLEFSVTSQDPDGQLIETWYRQ